MNEVSITPVSSIIEINNNSSTKELSITEFTNIALDICILLMESGAHCERINRNIDRIAYNSPYKVDLLLSFTAISITTTEKSNLHNSITLNKRIKHHGTHFGIVTETSHLTWKLVEKQISYNEIATNIQKIKEMQKHSIWKIRFFIGVACASLCIIAGGSLVDSLFAFVASSIGLIVRQEMNKRRFNILICIVSSAFITTLISGIDKYYDIGNYPTAAVATSVLFLIPGVTLINSIIDIMEGYIPTGIARGVLGGFILLCISIGMFISMALIGIKNF